MVASAIQAFKGVTILPATNIAPFQVSVAATATLIAANRTGRTVVTVVNSGTTPIFLGPAGVTTSTGVQLPGVAGASIQIAFSGDLYGVVASGSQAVTGYELY
jgi:hypothetical protein